MNKWIILTVRGNDTEPAWFESDANDPEGNRRPRLWDTKKEATIDLLDDIISTLEQQKEEVEADQRDPEEVDTDGFDWVSDCEVDDDGVIQVNGEVIYDPKTYVR